MTKLIIAWFTFTRGIVMMLWPQNEDHLKNEDNLKNDGDLKNEDDLKNKDDL